MPPAAALPCGDPERLNGDCGRPRRPWSACSSGRAQLAPVATSPRSYDPESVHQFRDLKAALVAVGSPLRRPEQRVAVQIHDGRTYLSWKTG